MQEPDRYFPNRYLDFSRGDPGIDVKIQKQRTIQLVKSIVGSVKRTPENANGGLYVGSAGIAYMLYQISENPVFDDMRTQYLAEAESYLHIPLSLTAQTNLHITDQTGFLTGNVGVFALAVVIYKKLGRHDEASRYLRKLIDASEILTNINWFPNGGDELFVGRAGYMCAILWMQRELNMAIISEEKEFQLLDLIIASGESYAIAKNSYFPLMYHYYDTEYLGVAHGLAGILCILLSFPTWLSNRSKAQELIRQSVDKLLALQTPSGNFPCAMDEVNPARPESEELIHWCHGAPGVVYLMIKAYQVYEDKKYLAASLKCGDVTWQKGLLKKGPGICHGVAGSGYVFLVLYRLTRNPAHLYRAGQFMNFMYTPDFKRARNPDCPYSLFEGLAGTACFAADLTLPDQASFPLFNLFL